MELFTHVRGEPNEKPSVILIHGLLGASRNLMRLQELIHQQGYHTIAYDQRGHGHSPHFQNHSPTISGLADDLYNLITKNNLERVHLIGHSLGGRVAMNLSATPEKSRSIVSLTMLDVGTAVNAEASRALHQIIDPLPDFFASKEEAKTFFGKIIPFTGAQKTMFEQFLLANLRDRNGKMVWVFDLSSIRDHLLSSLETPQTLMWKDLRVPTLVARGGNSEHFTQTELELLKESKPSIETALIPNAGHWVHVENLEGTFNAIKPFIDKHN